MSQTKSTADGPSPSGDAGPAVVISPTAWTRKHWCLYVGLPMAILALIIGGVFEHLLLGWLYFSLRTFPRISVDWPTAVLGCMSAVAFVAGLHRTLQWLMRGTSSSVALGSWSWRSTVVIAMTIVLMFVAGLAMIGMTHQFVWLWVGPAEPPGQDEAQSQRTFGFVALAWDAGRERSRRDAEGNNLKQIGLALHNMHDVRLYFPPGGTMDESGRLLHGWPIFLAPYSNYSNQGVDFSVPWNKPPNDRIYQCALPEYINPCISGPRFDARGFGLCHLAGNVHVMPICQVEMRNTPTSDWEAAVRKANRLVNMAAITDGTSNTLAVGTAGEQFRPWGHPANVRDPELGLNRQPSSFGGPKNWDGAMFLMCDGSVRFLSNRTDPQILKALGTPASGEQLPANTTEP